MLMDALTRIIADRSDGALFFGNYYMMDYELMGDDARAAIIAESARSGSNRSCLPWCRLIQNNGRCGSRRDPDPLPSLTFLELRGRWQSGVTSVVVISQNWLSQWLSRGPGSAKTMEAVPVDEKPKPVRISL
jgi:hypothetical protein